MKRILFSGAILAASLIACAPATTVKAYVDPSLTDASITAGGITVLPLLLSASVKQEFPS